MDQDISLDPAQYDPIATAYQEYADTDAYNALCERPCTLSLLPPVTGQSVLDAACGPGFYAAWCAQRGATVRGFDGSPAMVALAGADIVVVDFTNRNPNVYFEAGLADAWKKKWIVLAQSTNDLAFDVQHIRTIIYSNKMGADSKLRESLEQALKATMGAAGGVAE
jgi:SAM-dependent methyltransferase